jgi:ELWxxDGT repeat protein
MSGTIYFRGLSRLGNGYELFKTDGTTAGTQLIKDINPGSANSNPALLTNVNGVLYFRAETNSTLWEVWKSDGTTAGTVLLKDIHPSTGSSSGGYPSLLTNVAGTLYFLANDATNGYELWKSDGTPGGTVIAFDPTGPGAGSKPTSILQIDDRLFVDLNTEEYGREVWVSDLSAPTIPGDYNRDGIVDPSDYAFWRQNYGATSALGLRADGNANSIVDASDYVFWRKKSGAPAAAAAASGAMITSTAAADSNIETYQPSRVTASPAQERRALDVATPRLQFFRHFGAESSILNILPHRGIKTNSVKNDDRSNLALPWAVQWPSQSVPGDAIDNAIYAPSKSDADACSAVDVAFSDAELSPKFVYL